MQIASPVARQKTFAFPVDLLKEDDGSWSVTFQDLPGCITLGETREDALVNAAEAASLHLEGLREHGQNIPKPSDANGRPIVLVKV